MKKIFILLCLLLFKLGLFGQSLKMWVMAGANESSFLPSNQVVQLTPQNNYTSYHAGLFAEISWGSVSILPGLNYEGMGGTDIWEDAHGAGGGGTYKYTLNYLQVPVNVLYNAPIGVGKFFIGGGPYMAFGLSGKNEQSSEIGNFGSPPTYTSSNTGYAFSRPDNPDVGVNAIAGFKLNMGLLLSLGYQYGLKYLSNYPYRNGSYYNEPGVKTKVASISIGYNFL